MSFWHVYTQNHVGFHVVLQIYQWEIIFLSKFWWYPRTLDPFHYKGFWKKAIIFHNHSEKLYIYRWSSKVQLGFFSPILWHSKSYWFFPKFSKLSELAIEKKKLPKIPNFLVKKVMNFVRKKIGCNVMVFVLSILMLHHLAIGSQAN